MASSLPRPSTLVCAMVRFSVIDRCGNSSKCWNTMPTRERSCGRLVCGAAIEVPSTTMSPFWNGSRALTHLIRVDLPEPDGPHTTTTSPLFTWVVQSVRTWKSPYHLLTFLIEIIRLTFSACA
ncbi:hypothetical protein D3C78_1181220 [compost metagenome]